MKNSIKIISAIFILCLVSYLALIYGEETLSFNDVISGLFDENSPHSLVIREIRLPRLIAGTITGATLALSGAILRTVLKNPLADNAVLGISSGASFMVIVVMIIFPAFYFLAPILAFIGGFIAYLMGVTLAVKNAKIDPIKMILAGVAINAMFTSLVSIINIFHKDKIQFTISYLGGSIANINFQSSFVLAIYGVIAIALAFIYFPKIKVLRLDDNMIKNIGQNPTKLRIIASLIAVILATVSISFIGIIAFVGILTPFFAIKLVKSYDYWYFAMTMILGAILIVASDIFQKIIFYPMEVPVGTIIGVFGALLFIYFVKLERKSN